MIIYIFDALNDGDSSTAFLGLGTPNIRLSLVERIWIGLVYVFNGVKEGCP